MELKNIATALLAAQQEMGNAKKDSVNPFFKSVYADLNSVREATLPLLNKNGITVLQPIVSVDGKNFVKTMLLHTSGEFIESFTEIIYAKPNDAQAQGSGITYARRYGLQSLVCVGADDDDGNAASQPQQKQANNNQQSDDKPWLNKADKAGNLTDEWIKVATALRDKKATIQQVESKYKLSKINKEELSKL